MDSFEVNKILGAVLGTLTFTLALGIGSDILFSAHAPEKPGYELPSPAEDAGAGAGEAPAAEAVEPIATRLASADPAKGEALTKQCTSCHTFEKGGANKVGPNLYGILNRNHAEHEGFSYSDAMKEKAGEPWTFEALDHFIEAPQKAIPKTAMNFLGIKKPDQRASLIAWLNQNSDNPLPLPAAPAPGEAAAPADGGAPAGDTGTGGPTSVPQPQTGETGAAPTPPTGAPEGGTPEMPQGGAGNPTPAQPAQ